MSDAETVVDAARKFVSILDDYTASMPRTISRNRRSLKRMCFVKSSGSYSLKKAGNRALRWLLILSAVTKPAAII
jgi:hypothetical protein